MALFSGSERRKPRRKRHERKLKGKGRKRCSRKCCGRRKCRNWRKKNWRNRRSSRNRPGCEYISIVSIYSLYTFVSNIRSGARNKETFYHPLLLSMLFQKWPFSVFCSKSLFRYGGITSQISRGLVALEPPQNGGKGGGVLFFSFTIENEKENGKNTLDIL